MKIAVISDTHDNLVNLKKIFSFAEKEKIEILIHCGDVSNGETLEEIAKNFKGKIFLALGNADIKNSIADIGKKNPQIKIFEEFGEVVIDKLKIGFCHSPDLAQEICKKQNYDFIFYGHTHKPWLKETGKCFLANPGNLGELYFQATFAVCDTKTKKISLEILGIN